MKKFLLFTFLCSLFTATGFSQTDKFWSANNEAPGKIIKYKAVARLSFPKVFKLFDLNIDPLRAELFSVVSGNAFRYSTIISLPNANGKYEQFEVFEASNFEPALQAQFPEIRAFSGKGITDRSAILKLSISPRGVQAMVFRTDTENEFIEPYSNDHKVYAVFKSQRIKGNLPWTCATEDHELVSNVNSKIAAANFTSSSTGELKTMRLAQSCNGEYANYFGATSAADVALVLAAFNATISRCNGVYEKDLAVHLNLIANTTDVIFYNPATDPYTNMGAWNGQLQTTLTNTIGEANYDIGHMFGATGGGGNAGCIGCVCVNGQKGSGITSPADGIPEGDNFDIDYVIHEVGHQMGGNHTFSHANEGGGASLGLHNKEVGSGITIMGYAGITNYDGSPHSIDIFHEESIAQIQANLATKTCPVTTNISANNATPVLAPLNNYTIPISTPFALTGSATDANAGDILTYCWEQNDHGISGTTGANSKASPTKAAGPNWFSFVPTVSPTRICPVLATVLNGGFVTGPLPGGDPGFNIEALSSISRTLNFRLTVRDNCPYSSTAPVKVGQTAFADMVVTVTNTSGPFMVTQPNTNVSWAAGSSQTITWDVAATTGAPVSCANVKISMSTDGGFTFPFVLSAGTANDGSEIVTIPGGASTTARVKIEAVGNIFFDISNTNFTITAPANGYTFNSVAPASVACGTATASITLATTATGTFTTAIDLTATGNPAGTTVSFSVNPLTPGNSTVVTLNNVSTLAPGSYDITVTGIAGAVTQTSTLTFTVLPGIPPAITTQPSAVTVCEGDAASFTVTASGTGLTYQWQVSTGGPFNDITGANAATYTIPATVAAQNNNQYQVIISTLCGSATTIAAILTINPATSITTQPAASVTLCAGNDNTFTVAASGSNLTYQWQESTTGCAGTFIDIAGANSPDYTLTGITTGQDGYAYRVIITGTCAPVSITSDCSLLNVSGSVDITAQPSDVTVCSGTDAVFTVVATGTGVNYQWQVSTDGGITFIDITGAITATLTLTGITAASNSNLYQAIVTNSTCTTPSTSATALLTVNDVPAVTSQPSDASICVGGDVTFTATATGTNITYQWQLSTDGGITFTAIPGATGATYTVNAAATAMNSNQYQLVVSGSCTPVATSAPATLNVVSPVNITTQPVSAAACVGFDATLIVTADGGGATIGYQWQVSTDGGTTFTNISGETSAILTLTNVTAAMNGYQYQVILSNTICASVASAPVTLTVNALPVITATAGASAVCSGTAVQLTATGADTYTWAPGGLSGSTIIVNPTVDPNSPGIPNPVVYTVTGSDAATTCSGSTSVMVTANPLPVVMLTASPAITALLPGQTVLLTATVTPAGPFVFTWEKDGVVISNTGTTLTVGAADAGEYSVTAADPSGSCSSRSGIVTVSDSATTHLYIYPNPNEGQFIISYHNPGGIPVKRNVTVFDSHGARVFSKALAVIQPYELISVDLRPAASDVYIVVLYDGAGKRLASEKVVVRH